MQGSDENAPLSPEVLQVFVLSLPRAEARRRLAHAQLDFPGLPAYRILDAIDGSALGERELKAGYDEQASIRHSGRPLTRPEIGCALSHLAACRAIVEARLPFGVVMEDDALLGLHAMQVLRRLVQIIDPARPEVVLLSRTGTYSMWGSRKLDRVHRLYRVPGGQGAFGYFVTQAAARAMLEALHPVHTTADDWRHLRRLKAVDVYCVVPYCVGIAALGERSHIGEERFSQEGARGLRRWLRKYLYRKFIYQLVVKPLLRLRKHESSW